MTTTSNLTSPPFAVLEAALPADFDSLIRLAASGSSLAIGAVAILLYPDLFAIANGVLKHTEDSEEIVQQLLCNLADKRASLFPPARGREASWLGGLLCAMAMRRAHERAQDWGREAR